MMPAWKTFYVVLLSMINIWFVVLTKPIEEKYKRNPDKINENDSYIMTIVQTLQVCFYLVTQILLSRTIVEIFSWAIFLLWNFTLQIIVSGSFLIYIILYNKAGSFAVGVAVMDLMASLMFWYAVVEFFKMDANEE